MAIGIYRSDSLQRERVCGSSRSLLVPCSYAAARHETANENACLIFVNNDCIPPHDRFTDRVAGVVNDDLWRHQNPFTCRIHGIRNEVASRADFPIGAMPVGDITAATAAR